MGLGYGAERCRETTTGLTNDATAAARGGVRESAGCEFLAGVGTNGVRPIESLMLVLVAK